MSFLSALGRAIGDGMTLAAEILCPRDHTVEDRLRSWESAAVAVEDEICDEADTCEGEWEQMQCGVYPECDGNCCKHADDSSAAVSAAADPSPTVPNAHSVVGGEGRGEDSDILQSASLRRSTDPGEVAAPSPGEIDRAVLNAKNAAVDAVKRWAEPPGRGLIGASPAVVAGIAVRAYLEALNK